MAGDQPTEPAAEAKEDVPMTEETTQAEAEKTQETVAVAAAAEAETAKAEGEGKETVAGNKRKTSDGDDATQGDSKKAKVEPQEPLGEEGLKKLRTQLEFYFSDSNLRHDRYMNEQIALNDEGSIELTTFLRFMRVRQMTSSVQDLVAALGESETLLLTEDKAAVKRRVAFVRNEENDDQVIASSIFAAGFPTKSTIDEVRVPFAYVGGDKNIAFIKMRKGDDGSFLGSVLVECANPQVAAKLVSNKDKLLFDGEPLQDVRPMAEWVSTVRGGAAKPPHT